jgi:hypothetical protein
MKAPAKAGAIAPAVFLCAPATGWRVWFQIDPSGNVWFQRWYHSRSAAKAARTRMRCVGAVVVVPEAGRRLKLAADVLVALEVRGQRGQEPRRRDAHGSGGGVLTVIRNLLHYGQHPEWRQQVIYTLDKKKYSSFSTSSTFEILGIFNLFSQFNSCIFCFQSSLTKSWKKGIFNL